MVVVPPVDGIEEGVDFPHVFFPWDRVAVVELSSPLEGSIVLGRATEA